MASDLIFYVAIWAAGLILGWAMHERDWRQAYIVENKRLHKFLGERHAHETPVAYMVHNAMVARPHGALRTEGDLSEKTVWFYPAARHEHAKGAARTLNADITPLFAPTTAGGSNG
jgi:hypothetical protein